MVERRCNRGGNQPLFLSVGGSSALTPKAKVLMTVRLKPMRLGVTDTRRVEDADPHAQPVSATPPNIAAGRAAVKAAARRQEKTRPACATAILLFEAHDIDSARVRTFATFVRHDEDTPCHTCVGIGAEFLRPGDRAPTKGGVASHHA